jgi:hypothetical protein
MTLAAEAGAAASGSSTASAASSAGRPRHPHPPFERAAGLSNATRRPQLSLKQETNGETEIGKSKQCGAGTPLPANLIKTLIYRCGAGNPAPGHKNRCRASLCDPCNRRGREAAPWRGAFERDFGIPQWNAPQGWARKRGVI